MSGRNPKSGLIGLVERGDVMSLAVGGALLTLVVNLAGLTAPLYFTQIYDRVLVTGSVPTLLVLAGLAVLIILLGAMFDQMRTVFFTRMGVSVYVDLEPHVFRASQRAAAEGRPGRKGAALDDLESVRSAIAGPLPGAALDALFVPLYLVVLYMVHEWIGHLALFLLALVGVVSLITQWSISSAVRSAADNAREASSVAESHLRAAEAATAMGYGARAMEQWAQRNRRAVGSQVVASARAGGLTAMARGLRSAGQIIVISLAAYLALGNSVSGGAIIASSIIFARLLAPIDMLLGSWRQIAGAKIAAARLKDLVGSVEIGPQIETAAPVGPLRVDDVRAYGANQQPILRGVSFKVEPGEAVAVIGPTGAGKSTLLRSVLGVWPFASGAVRLGDVPLMEADRERVGRWLGFQPQNIDLAPGTIAENISRFDPSDAEAIREAARAAGAETMIASLPKGYDTEVGEQGDALSAGQRRRVALARALYGWPALVCLDEPEANLDRDGEIALGHALQQMKARGTTVLVATHKPSVLAHVDKVLVLSEGRVSRFGPAAEIVEELGVGSVRRSAT